MNKKCYLISNHTYPKFYRANGDQVEIELNYVTQKVFSYLDSEGQLQRIGVSGTVMGANDVWLVESVEEAMRQLEELGVYPFESKTAARTHAKRLGLKVFKYLQV